MGPNKATETGIPSLTLPPQEVLSGRDEGEGYSPRETNFPVVGLVGNRGIIRLVWAFGIFPGGSRRNPSMLLARHPSPPLCATQASF